MASLHVFVAATLVKLLVTTLATLYPLRLEDVLCDLKTLHGLLRLYSLPNSNLDVWLLSILQTLFLLAFLWQVALPSSQRHLRRVVHIPPFTQVGCTWVKEGLVLCLLL